jgi:hypothetical protein
VDLRKPIKLGRKMLLKSRVTVALKSNFTDEKVTPDSLLYQLVEEDCSQTESWDHHTC